MKNWNIYLMVFRRVKKTSKVTRVASPILRRPCWRVSGRWMMEQVLYFLVYNSTSITCSLDIRSCLSVCSLCLFFASGGSCSPHLGQAVSTVEKDLGHLAGRWSVSAASYLPRLCTPTLHLPAPKAGIKDQSNQEWRRWRDQEKKCR